MEILKTDVMQDEPRIISLTKIPDPRGNLSVIEENKDVPFKINRVYWISDVPGGAERSGHAYYENMEMIVALSGSFEVIIDDGVGEQKFLLNRADMALFVPKLTWRKLDNFSTNSVALVLASTFYDEKDYIYSFSDFKKIKNEK